MLTFLKMLSILMIYTLYWNAKKDTPMQFIHKRGKNCVNIFTKQKQFVLKIKGEPLLFCQQRNGYFLACGKETIRIDITRHSDEISLNVFYNQKHILSFMPETPERPDCFSVYDKIPELLTIPTQNEMIKNKWIFTDYTDNASVQTKTFQKPAIKKTLKVVIKSTPHGQKKAHLRGR